MKKINSLLEFIFNESFAIGLLLELFFMLYFTAMLPKISLMNPMLKISIYASVALLFLMIHIWYFIRKHYVTGVMNLLIVGGLWIGLLLVID